MTTESQPMTRKEREKAAYAEREATRRAEQKQQTRQLRRADSLYRHARMVYDSDRDVAGEFSAE